MKILSARLPALLGAGLIVLNASAADLTPAAVNREKIEALRQKAIASYQSGDYAQAARFYQEWVPLDPQNPLVLKDLMWALWNQQRFDEAADAARQITRLRPQDTDALDVLARVPTAANRARIQTLYKEAGQRMHSGKASDAVPLYRQLTVLDPLNHSITAHLLSGLYRTGQYREGADVAVQLARVRPRDAESWNWLARMEAGLDHPEAAIRAYEKSLALKPDQPAITLAMGKQCLSERDFDNAIYYLESLKIKGEEPAEFYPLLGKAQFWTQQYAKSALSWEKAVQKFPDNAGYRLYEAQSLYYSGRLEEARAKLRVLAFGQDHPKAFDFLVDDHLAQGDVAGAEKLLEEKLKTLQPQDEARAMKLATLYQANGQRVKWGIILDRFLDVWPDNLIALEMKAAQLYETDQVAQAAEVHKKVHQFNPNSTDALRRLAECEMAMGRIPEALRALEKLRALDPTNPYVLLQQANFLYAADKRGEAKRLVDQWLEKNRKSQVLPVLLYHGLTPFEKDPLLAYSYHMSVSNFEDQMRALRQAGYTPVTPGQVTDWYAHVAPLPPKAVMITFDDARLDSFLYSDPILEKYDLKATMFAALANTEGSRPPGFASWKRLRHYQQTGRWDIESHGDQAHVYIPIHPNGKRGLFLINRQWLEKENRMETVEEWKRRILADHDISKKKIAAHFGKEPSAYAFPEGYYGQQGNCNDPQTAPVNLELVLKSFKTAYTQDRYGINVGTRDPALLNRFIPDNTWKGKDLLKHFEENNPFNQMYMQRLRWAMTEGRTREALHWLKQLQRNGVSGSQLLLKESEIRFSVGDSSKAEALAKRALMMESVPEVQGMINSYSSKERRAWVPSYAYEQDNQKRRHWIVDQRLDVGHTGPVKWSLRHQHAEYRQNGVVAILDDAGGFGVGVPAGLFNHLSAEVAGHRLSSPSRNAVSVHGSLKSAWTDDFVTRLSGGRSLYNTALALNNNVRSTYGEIQTQWEPRDGSWKAGGRGRCSALSDGNRRLTAWLEVSRRLVESGFARGVYRFTYDDMRTGNPNYYSPREVRLQALGPEIVGSYRKSLAFRLRYLPSYSQERGLSDEFNHDIEADMTWHLGRRVSFKPSYEYYATPSYSDSRYGAEFTYRF